MLRVIGDLHGRVNRPGRMGDLYAPRAAGRSYAQMIRGIDYSLQIGDYAVLESDVYAINADPERHKILYGNHDNYDHRLRNDIGDFGTYSLGGITFGFLRGENSIDKERSLREEFNDGIKRWWVEEELTWPQMYEAIDFFHGRKLDFMITHGAPDFLIPELVEVVRFLPSRTSQLLTRIYNDADIKTWIFGHYHKDWSMQVGNTKFICVNELCYLDIEDNGTIGTVA